MEKFAARLVEPFVSVGAEVVALRLQQVRGQPSAPVAIEVGQCGAHARNGNAGLHCGDYDAPPCGLSAGDGLVEERVKQQIDQLVIAVKGLLDVAEEG